MFGKKQSLTSKENQIAGKIGDNDWSGMLGEEGGVNIWTPNGHCD